MFRIYLTLFLLLVTACTSPIRKSDGPVAQLKKTGKTKLVLFNKHDFLKTKAQKPTVSATYVKALAYMLHANNIQEMPHINGYTIDGADLEKVQANLPKLGPDWILQEEVDYHVMETLYRLTPVETTKPVCPNPGNGGDDTPKPVETSKSWGVTRVHGMEAKAKVDTSKVKVCVIDTGIDLNHAGNGRVVASAGIAGPVQDGNGHGTHTAGTIAGINGVGVSRASLLICKGLSDQGSGSSSGLANCLAWCGQQGAQIVSNSWGSTQSDNIINQAVASLTAKGIYVFVAAGNDSGPVNWPARLAGNNPLVYAIAASDQGDRIASFSSRGPEVRYISPGVQIVSNRPGGGTVPMDGTSMSTPHAAAICAYGVARGAKPCIKTSGTVAGYPFADALSSAQ